MSTDIIHALLTADIDADRIRERPDGTVSIERTDGGRIVIGEDDEGEWWDYTRYSDDDTIEGTDGGSNLGMVAAEIADLIK